MAKKHKTIVGNKIVTPKARLSYPSLFAPDTGGQYSDDKYKATLLMDTGTVGEEIKNLQRAVLKVAKEAFGEETKLADIAHPFRKGNEKLTDDDSVAPGYQDMIYIIPKSKYRPDVVDGSLKNAEETDVYAGCFVRASVYPYSYVSGNNKGVTFRLGNVQKVSDGEPFGGTGSKAADDFDAVSDVNESEAFDDDDL